MLVVQWLGPAMRFVRLGSVVVFVHWLYCCDGLAEYRYRQLDEEICPLLALCCLAAVGRL